MKVLIKCEESQAVCKAFRDRGHEAYSNDILSCSGGRDDWHIQGDCLIHKRSDYDLNISFPPCTDLSVSGARWFPLKRANGSQRKSILFFLKVWEESDCVENPIGIMNTGIYIKEHFPDLHEYAVSIGFPFKPTQIIQPWQFGHGETKATCLWLRGLPKLTPTDIVEGREQRIWKLPPSEDRGKLRSKTFQGIAEAMASQWSEYILKQDLIPTT